MEFEILDSTHNNIGDRVTLLAICSRVEILQNLTQVGSHREIYHLHGKQNAYLPGLIFKQGTRPLVDPSAYKDEPVLVEGTISEYQGVTQIHIETIVPVGDKVDKNDLLAEISDLRLVDAINDHFFQLKSLIMFNASHLKPASGLIDSNAGTYLERLNLILVLSRVMYPHLVEEYVENISLTSDFYLNSEGSLDDRLETISLTDSKLVRALIFKNDEYPEYTEFVNFHHMIMKPVGVTVQVSNNYFSSTTQQ